MTGPLLAVEGLKVEFGHGSRPLVAVEDLSFTLDRGKTLVIVGESGSGKSVASLAIMNLVPSPAGRVTGGSIRFTGRDGATRDLLQLDHAGIRKLRGAEIAMIFQEPMSALNPVYTIGWQITEALTCHEPMSTTAARRRGVELLEWMGVPDPHRRFDSYPHELSGGLRQRAMIAVALSCRPSLLIADEPTTALDVTVQAQILDLIQRLQAETGMAVIFITHHLGVAADIADDVMVMYAGRAVESGPADMIFNEPRMPYTQGLLASVPTLGRDAVAGPLYAIPGSIPSLASPPRGCTFHPRCTFAIEDPCTRAVPPLEACGAGHLVRCARWREIGELA